MGECDEFGVGMKSKSRRVSGGDVDAMEGELEREMEALEESLLRAPMLSGMASLSPSPSPSPIPSPPPLSLRIPKTRAAKDKNGLSARPVEGGDDDETPTRTPTLTSSTSSGTLNSTIVEGEVRTPVDGAPLGSSARLDSSLRRDARAKFGLGLKGTKEKPLPLVPPLGSEVENVVDELEVQRPMFEMAVCGPSPVRAEHFISDKTATPAAARSAAPRGSQRSRRMRARMEVTILTFRCRL